jgi:hypothetical protein
VLLSSTCCCLFLVLPSCSAAAAAAASAATTNNDSYHHIRQTMGGDYHQPPCKQDGKPPATAFPASGTRQGAVDSPLWQTLDLTCISNTACRHRFFCALYFGYAPFPQFRLCGPSLARDWELVGPGRGIVLCKAQHCRVRGQSDRVCPCQYTVVGNRRRRNGQDLDLSDPPSTTTARRPPRRS